ncbi:NIPSNAP family protein [Pontibacter anaerobius]|uniref:NIPSNAP family protein n=1 Tax=Pontibacter anaerobius TaxID=2993940 RepID=A0ABT3RC91_9BACT|nr:NIPSNAP family protein [Pontibacter anaerobius]MCX2739056.1 NIPSNAP family protein [Pontibacter anaerobius]
MMNFRRTGFIAFCLSVFALIFLSQINSFAQKQSYYQLKVYHLKDKEQEARLDHYLEQAYLPALHRAGIKQVGVFKPANEVDQNHSSEPKVYVLLPFTSLEQFAGLEDKLAHDKKYAAAGEAYIQAAHDKPYYQRIETSLMQAFAGMPAMKAPNLASSPSERIYELRSYEAATEKLHQNKVDMFNNGEIQLFDRLGFNAVFYGKVLASNKMPNLMYMTSFENFADREARWKSFSQDPEWKKMSAMPEYANNFLRADIYLLHPTNYSDI